MKVARIVGLTIVCVAVVLLILGIRGTGAMIDPSRQELTRHYGGRATWYLLAGVLGIAVGGALSITGRRDDTPPGD